MSIHAFLAYYLLNILSRFVLDPTLKPGERCNKANTFCDNHVVCKMCLGDEGYKCISGNHWVQLDVNLSFVVRV